MLGQVEAAAAPALISAALAKTNLGNLNGVVNQRGRPVGRPLLDLGVR